MDEDILTQLQKDIAARLRADEYFADIPVVTEVDGDVAAKVAQLLGTLSGKSGKKGVCAVVMQMLASASQTNAPLLELNALPTVRILENPLINMGSSGTKKSALSVAVRTLMVMRFFADDGITQLMGTETPSIVAEKDPAAPVAYEVRFEAEVVAAGRLAKVVTPSIDVTGTDYPMEVTITCATEDAQIYYTLDGSYPAPGETAATLYSGPFSLVAAGLIRAVATKSQFIASNLRSWPNN